MICITCTGFEPLVIVLDQGELLDVLDLGEVGGSVANEIEGCDLIKIHVTEFGGRAIEGAFELCPLRVTVGRTHTKRAQVELVLRLCNLR